MYELARADAGILHASAALRPESGAEVLVAGVVDVSSSGAVYLGPADGDNGAQGLVVRVPPGRLRVLATRRANGVAAVSLELLPGEETQRAPLPAPAYWHEAPGGLPVVTSERWPLLICDAALRDQFRNPQEGFPWHQWLSDVVRSALLASGGLGVAPVSWPGRAESFVAVDGAVAPEGLVVFGGFSAEGRPVHLHGHVLVSAVDAPHSGPGVAARPEQPEAPLPPAAGPRPVQPPPMGEPEPSPLMDSLGRAGSRTSHAWVAAAARGQSLPQDHARPDRPEEEQAPPAPPAMRPPRPSGTTIIAPNRTVDTLLDDDDEAGSSGAEQGSPEAADPRDGPAKRSRWPRLPRRRQKQAEPASGQPWTAAPPPAPGGAQGR
ncbi:MAG: hypothetical protein Q4E05_07295, partial [Pseudoclavibacter sp.]|nr:hypothetical protein [Pseudoclavibacter sp.]